MKILLIEDNLTIIKGLKYNLEINDFVVLVASCIKDAKEYLINDDPELIILDIITLIYGIILITSSRLLWKMLKM